MSLLFCILLTGSHFENIAGLTLGWEGDRSDAEGGGGQRRRTGGDGRRVLLGGHSLIVSNSRSGGDPVATREISAEHSGKVAFNLLTLANIYYRSVSHEQAPPSPPDSVRWIITPVHGLHMPRLLSCRITNRHLLSPLRRLTFCFIQPF